MARAKILLYVDVISPFAYMTYYMLRHSPVFKDVQVTYVPILLGGLMKACDNRTPLEIKNKAAWINIERLRWARQFNIPMTEDTPEGFPRPTLPLQRFLTALHASQPALLAPALDTLYATMWSPASTAVRPRLSVVDPAVFGPLLARHLPAAAVQECVGAMGTDPVKKALVARTDEAFAAGAFGLPWLVCERSDGVVEQFWGFDHLGQVTVFLGLDGLQALGAAEGGQREAARALL